MAAYPHIRALLEGPVPDLIIAEWSRLAEEHRATGFYGSYLSFERLFPYEGNEMATAVANTAPYAAVLESGHGGFHLPSAIDWGAAVGRGTAKLSARGMRYLRIPFRHTTPGTAAGGMSSARARTMMPAAVYRDALTALRGDRTRAEAVRAAERLRQAGTQITRHYGLMQAQIPTFPRGLLAKARRQEGQPGYTWRARTYEGLTYRAQTNPETGRTSGVFQTFRTVTEDSAGWYIPPLPGYQFAARTVEAVRSQIEGLLVEAAHDDLLQAVQVQVG